MNVKGELFSRTSSQGISKSVQAASASITILKVEREMARIESCESLDKKLPKVLLPLQLKKL
jgi:hypothetical protein